MNSMPLRTKSAASLLGTLTLLTLLLMPGIGQAHEGPDPVAHWTFSSRTIKGNTVAARIGPDGRLAGRTRIVTDKHGESLEFSGLKSACVISEDINEIRKALPREAITISAWVTIDKRKSWGGILGAFQDNGDAESGCLLGYDEDTFYFALASEGADDGNGMLTYLRGKTKYKLGKWYHVVGIYDGTKMKLYINGELEAESDEQAGAILYPTKASLVIGAYRDHNENNLHEGRIREVSLYDLAAKDAWVAHEFKHQKQLATLPVTKQSARQSFLVKPYLQFGTQTSMTVMWQTSQPGNSIVHYGETAECLKQVKLEEKKSLHEVKIVGLKPETQYFYRVETQREEDVNIQSQGFTFGTAVKTETPYAFVVIGDTQGNPTVSAKLSKLAWAQRPNFALHAGDLVDTGTIDSHWTQHFFPGMEELICRVPFYPVLGNHERNAKNYFDYVSLPDPEYYYDFKYGNAHFFMLDSNRNVGPKSEQYRWLDKQLAASDSIWKFVCHHHPPYSSDENDYGDLWKTNQSSHGDMRARQLVKLYEKYRVDMVFNGHIHSYERTWPVRADRAAQSDAPIYVVTGGGGGGLETPGPVRPFFQNHVRRSHHYVMIHINGHTLEFRAYTLDDRLFDTLRIEKKGR